MLTILEAELSNNPQRKEKAMRAKVIISSAVVLILSAVVLITPAKAANANVFFMKGPGAEAFFVSVDETGCVESAVFVAGNDSMSVAPPGHFDSPPGDVNMTSGAFLFISVIDFCRGEELVNAFGSLAELEDNAFQTKGKLDSASLTGTIPVFNEVSGTSFDVFVDLDWSATGPLTFENDHTHLQHPCFTANSRFIGKSRSAQASGGVSNGTVNYTPNPSEFANIGDSKIGFIAIEICD